MHKTTMEEAALQPLHIETPLIESLPLSQRVKGAVWLKMDALQPSGSFKLRGIGYACRKYISKGARGLISSSGGNAGIAVAYAGRKLDVPVTVVVPESTSQRAIEIIQQEQADVIVKGRIWQEAHDFALSLKDKDNILIHPFDDSLIWTGHASLIDEVRNSGFVPDAVVLSVGGGGLMCGIIEGLRRNGWDNVPVLAVETEGADSLSKSLASGQYLEIENITSIATSLGAKKVAETAFEWSNRHKVISHVVSDKQAVEACLNFATDHRLLVEPACGAALAAVYDPPTFLRDKENILVVVCGGAGVTLSQLYTWKKEFGI